MVVRFTAEGRNILFGDRFKQVSGQTVQQRTITPAEQAALLAEHFGLAPG